MLFRSIFAANDHVALGIMRAMAEQGRRIPAEVSLVGFDDVPEAGYFHPALSTIRQEFAEVGRQALRLLLDQLATGDDSAGSALVEPVLIPRDTVGPPPYRA